MKKNGHPRPSPLWNEIEQEVYALRHLPIPPEEKLKRAAELAVIYRKYNRPLPDELAILI